MLIISFLVNLFLKPYLYIREIITGFFLIQCFNYSRICLNLILINNNKNLRIIHFFT